MRNFKINSNVVRVILFSSFLVTNISLFAQENIASKATCSTSYVSSWESLVAIKDGYQPISSGDKGPGAYGNWQSGVTNQWNWVQYTFPDFYKISKSDVYWWTDGQGIYLPYDGYLQYWNISQNAWVKVANPSAYGFEVDKYNTTAFDTILTNQIRLNFVSTAAQGILEWKIYGEKGEQIPYRSTVSYSQVLKKSTTSTYTVRAYDKTNKIVPGYVFKLDAFVIKSLPQDSEVYVINGQNITDSTRNIVLPPTDSTGKLVFSVTLPESINPTNGLEIVLKFNEGKTALKTYKYLEAGLTPPSISADLTSNNVDNDIELAFTDNAEWRSAIKNVFVGGVALPATNFTITPGKIILKPEAGNNLTLAGTKSISIAATRYTNVLVSQVILAGSVDSVVSTVTSELKLFKSVNIPFTVRASDKFGNAVSGYVFKWDAVVTNANVLNRESYTVNGVTVNASISDQNLLATNASGLTTFKVAIPATVNLNDGITIKIKTTDGTILQQKIEYVSKSTEKQPYVDYKLKTYEWSYTKCAQSDNFAIFWGDLVGADPLHPANGSTSIAFNPVDMLKQLEGYLALYVDTFGFINNKTTGNMSKYKFMVVVTDTWNNSGYANGYANGGSTDGVIGAMWVHPSATGGSGFVLAHEFAHMCQAMIPIQYAGKGIKDPSNGSYNLGMFWESHANFMGFTATGDIARAYPQRFVNTAMLHFSSTSHYYENNFFLQYLYDNYGMEEINKIWRNATVGMHPLISLKNNKGWSQNQLNDEFGKYAMRNVTWDYTIHDELSKVLKSLGHQVVCREYTVLDTSRFKPGTYVVPKEMAPGDYGYNIIKLFPNDDATNVSVDFEGYKNTPSGGAGWRFGLVAVDKTGKPRYSSLYTSGTGEIDWTAQDSSLYLVVTAAPAVHHNYLWNPGWPKIYRYPYGVKITGALPAGHKSGYNSKKYIYPGKAHSKGGGWVASTASVASTAFVGPNAQVLGTAKVTGNARIEDYAIVLDNAVINGNAIIRGNSMVGSNAVVGLNAIVEKSARVFYTSNISGSARITGNAMVNSSSVSGSAVVKDLAWMDNATLSGTVIVGGDAEGFAACSSGTYLQDYDLRNGDGLINHVMNVDVNPYIAEYDSVVTAINGTKKETISVYPNPATDYITINCIGETNARIYDIAGKCVLDFNISGETTIPTSKIGTKGVYFVMFNTGNERFVEKIVIR